MKKTETQNAQRERRMLCPARQQHPAGSGRLGARMQELAQRNPRPPALVTREGSLCRPPYGIVPIRLTRPLTPTHTHARDALEPRSPCPSPGCGMRQCQRQASPRIGGVRVHVVSEATPRPRRHGSLHSGVLQTLPRTCGKRLGCGAVLREHLRNV